MQNKNLVQDGEGVQHTNEPVLHDFVVKAQHPFLVRVVERREPVDAHHGLTFVRKGRKTGRKKRRKEGRKEGRIEGRKEERKEGRKKVRKEAKRLGG